MYTPCPPVSWVDRSAAGPDGRVVVTGGAVVAGADCALPALLEQAARPTSAAQATAVTARHDRRGVRLVRAIVLIPMSPWWLALPRWRTGQNRHRWSAVAEYVVHGTS